MRLSWFSPLGLLAGQRYLKVQLPLGIWPCYLQSSPLNMLLPFYKVRKTLLTQVPNLTALAELWKLFQEPVNAYLGAGAFIWTQWHVKQKQRRNNKNPKNQCSASRIKIKQRPFRAARFNQCVCPQLENFLGLLHWALSVALHEQFRYLHWCSQVGLSPFPEGGIRASKGSAACKKRARSILTAFQTKAYQFWTVILVTLEICSPIRLKTILE